MIRYNRHWFLDYRTKSPLVAFFCTTVLQRERTFIMVKPDGLRRALVGEVIKRLEQKCYKLVSIKVMMATEDLLYKHYKHLVKAPFFPSLISYMTSGPVVPMVWEGKHAVNAGLLLVGSTDPMTSTPGTMRGDFCIAPVRNMVHRSDSVENAKAEIELWFKGNELVEWTQENTNWCYED